MTRFRGSQIRRRGAALLVTFGLCLGLFAPAAQAGPSDSTVKELSNGQPHAILIGLLLPAIQKSTESPVNCPSDPGQSELLKEVGSVDPTGILIGMLLWDIQKSSSASPETNPLDQHGDLVQVEPDDSGMLLPAVQKVREAGNRSPGPDRIERSTVSESPELFSPTGPSGPSGGGGSTQGAPDVKTGAMPQGR